MTDNNLNRHPRMPMYISLVEDLAALRTVKTLDY